MKNARQVRRIVGLGVEKVAMSSAVVENMKLITDTAQQVGGQSVVVVIDVKKKGLFGGHYEVFIHNGTKGTGLDPVDFARKAEEAGAGEIVINSIDRDGTMEGYDLALIDSIRKTTSVPVTAIGGVGTLADISGLVDRYGIIGAGAGSFFVFKGVYRAVLISYPNRIEKEKIWSKHPQSTTYHKEEL